MQYLVSLVILILSTVILVIGVDRYSINHDISCLIGYLGMVAIFIGFGIMLNLCMLLDSFQNTGIEIMRNLCSVYKRLDSIYEQIKKFQPKPGKE